MLPPLRSQRAAFTLLELLVVISIIALLAAILFPAFVRVRENARRTSCASNMKQIGLGLMQYVQDYDETLLMYYRADDGTLFGTPAPTIYVTWQSAVQPYLKSDQIFHCPSNKSTSVTQRDYGGNVINAGTWWGGQGDGTFSAASGPPPKLSTVSNPARTIWVVECIQTGGYFNFNDGPGGYGLRVQHLQTSNYLYSDGHVKALRPLTTVAGGVNQWTRDNSKSVASVTLLQLGLDTAEANAK